MNQNNRAETGAKQNGQPSIEQIAELLRSNPGLFQSLADLLKSQPENPSTPDKEAAEKNDERLRRGEDDVNPDDPGILIIQGSYEFKLSSTATKIFARLNEAGNYFQRGAEIVRVTANGFEPETGQMLRTTIEDKFKNIYIANSKKDSAYYQCPRPNLCVFSRDRRRPTRNRRSQHRRRHEYRGPRRRDFPSLLRHANRPCPGYQHRPYSSARYRHRRRSRRRRQRGRNGSPHHRWRGFSRPSRR